MVINRTLACFFSTKAFTVLWVYRIPSLLIFTIQIFLIPPSICQGSEIIIRLSEDINYPGDLSVLAKPLNLKKFVFSEFMRKEK